MERKLASIQRITSVEPFLVADNSEIVMVNNWTTISQKGEFQLNDLCVYIEIDSVVPPIPEFDFLKHKNFRVRPLKLKGVTSQGLSVPISVLDHNNHVGLATGLGIGTDVTTLLGVRKYVPKVSVHLEGDIKEKRPPFVKRTKEVQINKHLELLEELNNTTVYLSTKVDGTCMSVYSYTKTDCPVYRDRRVFGVCNRNFSLKSSYKNAYWKMTRTLDLFDKLNAHPLRDKFVVIQGELCGPGIQRNKLELTKIEWLVFNVWIDGELTSLNEMQKTCEILGLKTVPIEEDNLVFEHSLEWLIERAKGTYAGTINEKEGIIIRPRVPKISPSLNYRYLSTKCNNPNYNPKVK